MRTPTGTRTLLRRAGAVLAAAALGGCAVVGRDYVKPDTAAPAAWSTAPAGTAPAAVDARDLARWWTVFHDPLLDSLMERAAKASPDLRIAEARVREARAQRGVAASQEWPSVGASGSYTRLRDNTPPFPPEGVVGSLYRAGFDSSWELDLFGGVRRSVEAADADLGASVEERRAVLVTLFGEVARNYVEARGFQLRLAVARENVETQRETRAITKARADAGLASEFDVTRAEAQLAAFEAQVPALEAALQRTWHRLAVLLGQEPGALVAELSAPGPIPVPPPDVRLGVPADLLLRRPDVRRAERELAAATARIGVAEADLYPRVALFGSFGFQNFTFADFTDWSSRVWTLGPRVRLPLFEGGRTLSHIQAQNARTEQALARYDRTFLTALEDVDNALVSYGKEAERRRHLAAAVAENASAFDTARALYDAGLAEYLQVLDAHRSLAASRGLLAVSETDVSSYLVALYKALGGGWNEETGVAESSHR